MQIVQGGWAFPKIMKIVIMMIIDEDKTKILMLCKLAREAEVQLVLGGRPNPTHANA